MGTIVVKALVGLGIPIMVSVYLLTQKSADSGTLLWACFWEVCVAGYLFEQAQGEGLYGYKSVIVNV